MLSLTVEKRDSAGAKAPALRRAGKVPGIVYGPHHKPTPVALDAREFAKVLKEAGESTIVALQGLGTDVPTLIYSVDLDPISNEPHHVDFYAVTKGEKVEVAIPLAFTGEAPVAKVAGLNVVKVMHELSIEADPMSLPHEISVDLSSLAKADDQVRAGDLVLPAGVELVTDAEEVVVLVQEVEEETEESAPADLSAIEVEKKGKEEEGAAADEAA